ncbi:MAG: hypothetical protein H6656_10130 [Ardenticatenaceae bacterium]|nr:hypothetical protein [Ardenticatenaceae bacterium]
MQVEHSVTEAITGLDLVSAQIQIAEGQPLPSARKSLAIQGLRPGVPPPQRPGPIFARDWHHLGLAAMKRTGHSCRQRRGKRVGHFDLPIRCWPRLSPTPLPPEAIRKMQGAARIGAARPGHQPPPASCSKSLAQPAFLAGQITTNFIEPILPAEKRATAYRRTITNAQRWWAPVWRSGNVQLEPPPEFNGGLAKQRWGGPKRFTVRTNRPDDAHFNCLQITGEMLAVVLLETAVPSNLRTLTLAAALLHLTADGNDCTSMPAAWATKSSTPHRFQQASQSRPGSSYRAKVYRWSCPWW